MLVLGANTKKHLEGLARGWDLAEISPWTGASSRKWWTAHCACCQGYRHRLQAGMASPLPWRKSVPSLSGCRDSSWEPPWMPEALSLAGSTLSPALWPGASPSNLGLEEPNGHQHQALSSLRQRSMAETQCKDCRCKRDPFKWQPLRSPLQTGLEMWVVNTRDAGDDGEELFAPLDVSCHIALD